MLHRAGRYALSAVLVFSAFTGAVMAQVAPAQKAKTHRKLMTPYDRYVRPQLEKLAASATQTRTTHAATALTAADTSATLTPNFGGYVGATDYQARATNSAQFDPLNNGVNQVLTADFDKDGHPDIAVIQSDGTLNILHNNGVGVLSAPLGYLNASANVQSTNIFQSFVVDLNGDGYPDIVALDGNNSAILTYLNAGDGTFGQPTVTQLDVTLGNATAIAAGDVNGDGKSDVVVAWLNQQATSPVMTLQSLLSKGDGTFTVQTVQNFSVPASVAEQGGAPLALGDINGDGKLDLVATLTSSMGFFGGTYSVSTLIGNGDGTFGPPSAGMMSGSYIFGSVPNQSNVQLGDFNGDGNLDIAFDCNDVLTVALGNGDNTFQTPVTSTFQSSASDVYLDFNGDGKLDVISTGNGGISISLGNGDGTFAAPALNAQYASATESSATGQLAIADFNGDKSLDAATLDVEEFQVAVFNGNGNGKLQAPVNLSTPADQDVYDFDLVGAVNANGDAYTDLVVADSELTGFLYTGLNDGKGNFKYVQSLASLPSDLSGVETFQGDFNGDGKQDLILTGASGEIWVALANGDGTFGTPINANLPTVGCSLGAGAAGDLNGDGNVDMIIAYPGDAACGSSGTNPSGYFVLKGNGDGTFQPATLYPAGEELVSATLADMNLDGKLDVLLNDAPVADTTGYEVTLELGNGDGSFGAPLTVISNYLVSDLKAGDVNGDGKPDLVVASAGLVGSDISTAGIVYVEGNGDGTFGPHNQIATGNEFSAIQIADVNGDGIPDIEALLENYEGEQTVYHQFVTLLGVGGGGFAAPYNQDVQRGGGLILTGNFYDDNALDLVLQSGSGVVLFLGQGGTTVSLTPSSPSINVGDDETLTATVAASMANRPAPTGSVSFYDGATLLGTATVNSGSATFSSSALAVGTHSITASYTGDSNYDANTAAATSVTVNALAPAFTLTGSASTLTLQQGANGTVVLTLAANATFSGPITLACTGAPTNSTCSFDTSTVTLTAGGTSSATLIFGTTGTVTAANTPPNPWGRTAGMISMAGLAAFFWSRRRRLHYMNAFGVALLATAVFGLAGCGGSNSTSSKVTTSTTPTAPVASTGSYTLTVTATATGSTAPAQTATVDVTVQ